MARVYTGSCHCGAVAFEVELEHPPASAVRCNCSLCRRRGALMLAVPQEKLEVVKGADKLSLYQWNTRVAEHYFCSVCGVYTHHRRRSDPSQYGFNVACLEDVDAFAIEDVKVLNGAGLSVV